MAYLIRPIFITATELSTASPICTRYPVLFNVKAGIERPHVPQEQILNTIKLLIN